ncbi:hypothetical protein B0H16DRAFT_1460913 [Mycena metata]|uniref:Uncharacterized protein n=1 Tax=Mycena metata TaxID=1033252 RepID=A0AAD7IU88_9AGAR|nr:hypothetical protein B0H16DRAFT_1460913 [Mycena metata]
MHRRRRGNAGEYFLRFPPTVLLLYGVSTTTITYGLPRAQQQELLDKHRARYFQDQTRLIRAKAKARGDRERPLPNMKDYDLCCEYYREVYTMQTASSAALYATASAYGSDSDTDSDSTSSSMPPLEPSCRETSPIVGNTLPYPCPAVDIVGDALPDTWPAVDTDPHAADANAATADAANAATATDTPAADAANVTKGERYVDMDTVLTANGYIPVAELAENLNLPPGAILENRPHTDGEAVERVWSLLNEVNRPTFKDMAPPRRRDLFSEYDPPSHRLKILTRTGIRHVHCRCRNGLHSNYERRHAYAFSDGDGNIVVKKSKSLLLRLS